MIIRRECTNLYSEFKILEESEIKKRYDFDKNDEKDQNENDEEICICEYDTNCTYCAEQFEREKDVDTLGTWTKESLRRKN